MIGKNIPLDDRVMKRHGERMMALCRYLAQIDAKKATRRPDVFFLNVLAEATGDIELRALAQVNPRARQPIRHMVHSWPADEHPSVEQAKAVAEILLQECGLVGCLAKCALQYDTDNFHLHVVVCTVDPDTQRMRKTAFIEEALHRSCALSEHRFGWRPEAGARYRIDATGAVVRRIEPGAAEASASKSQHERAARMEAFTGERSAQSVAQEVVQRAIESSRVSDWRTFHETLADAGLRYTTVRGGAVIEVHQGPTPVAIKASSVNRKATLKTLEKRFGRFQPYSGMVTPRAPEPSSACSDGGQRAKLWEAYQRERDEWRARREGYQALRARHQVEFKRLLERQRAERTAIFASRASGARATGLPRDVLNALRSVLAGDQAKEQAALRDRQAQERAQRQRDRLPSFDDWIAARLQGETAQFGGQFEGSWVTPEPRDIRAYQHVAIGGSVHYVRNERTHFVDHGMRIELHRGDDPVSLVGAIQLAVQKWPRGFVVRGSMEFKAAVVKAAIEIGAAKRINNPELQGLIESELEQRALQRRAARRSKDEMRLASPAADGGTHSGNDGGSPRRSRMSR